MTRLAIIAFIENAVAAQSKFFRANLKLICAACRQKTERIARFDFIECGYII